MSQLLTPPPPHTAFGDDADPGSGRPAAARLINASKIYGNDESGVIALDDVDLALRPGRFTAIMGPSGSGKSTLMHCAAGLDRLSSGSAFLGETNLSDLDNRELTLLRREQLGFVFQAFNLIPSLNAAENITLPLALAGKQPDPSVYERIVNVLGLESRLGHRPAQLSGGQQQRVAVARALVAQPRLIFADEPTGNLDSQSGHEILRFLRGAVDDIGQTIAMVTHDPNAAAWADTVVFVEDGRLVDRMTEPTAESVLDRMKRFGR